MKVNILTILLIIPSFIFAQQQITKTMIYNGDSREYIVYVPEGCNNNITCPLLFSFHGGSGYANDFIQANDMRPIADTANFIAVYPQGAYDYDALEEGQDSSEASTSWIHKAPTDHDDIYFVEAIIDENKRLIEKKVYKYDTYDRVSSIKTYDMLRRGKNDNEIPKTLITYEYH